MIREYYIRVATGYWILIALVILAGCATSKTHIEATHDPAANFSEFRTFGFAEPPGTDRRGARTALSSELVFSTIRELQARGMQPVSSNPDLLIDFFVAEQTGMGTSSQFAHAHGGVSTWSGYDPRTPRSSQIVEGLLTIDIIDARRGALVFEGMADARITESMRDNLEETISGVVTKVLARMP